MRKKSTARLDMERSGRERQKLSFPSPEIHDGGRTMGWLEMDRVRGGEGKAPVGRVESRTAS